MLKHSETASELLVLRPNSSTTTKLQLVADLKEMAISPISCKKELEANNTSWEKTTKIWSTRRKFALWAGTNDPICAITWITTNCLRKVDFPDPLGPVTIKQRKKFESFGTKWKSCELSKTGCRPWMTTIGPSGANSGRTKELLTVTT